MSNATPKAKQEAAPAAFVLYVDHQGHPAPLQESYHATASRRLSSSVDRYPSSTVLEVDSAYCPQCLSFHDAAKASTLGYCPKASCQQCPRCTTTVTIDVQDESVFYKCPTCDWTSRDCNLSVQVEQEDDGSMDKIELARAVDDLSNRLKELRREQQQPAAAYFTSLQKSLEKRSKEEHQRQTRISLKASAAAAAAHGPEGVWSVQALEASLQEKRNLLAANATAETVEGAVERLSLDNDNDADTDAPESLTDASSQLGLQLQSLNGTLAPGPVVKSWLPLPMPLRVRTSRRCRAELAAGRPGILLKPKLNPLEGDSSLRTGHGQWWKKDSSAVHVIPRVQPVRHVVVQQNDDSKHIFLLRVTNPTLGTIRLRFATSTYPGEVDRETNAVTEKLSDLLVDTFTGQHVNAQLERDVLKLAATEHVELLSAEDSFIEFGSGGKEIPYKVLRWEPSATTAADTSAMQLVAQSASTAWFELVVPNVPAVDAAWRPAVPLALQIEVGNGSWQSSLVQPKPVEGEEQDWVTFDLVITWE